jgi:drug/metabolite transporter (DMT)-like permease
MTNHRLLPYLYILVAGVLWGSTFSFALIATADGTHPIALTLWQVLLTAMVFVFICLYKKLPIFKLKNLRQYLIIGILGIVGPDILYYSAAPHLSAGILSITVSTVPVFTYIIMWIMGYESLVIKRALGIVLGMIAILLLVLPDQGLSSGDANFWILVVTGTALLYACENVYISEGIGEDISIFELLCGSTLISTLFLIPVTIWMGVGQPISWIFSTSGWAITAIAILSTIAYTLFFYTIKKSGPVFASQCAYIVTISGVIIGLIVFSEKHTIWVWVSVAVMILGVALVSPSEEEESSTQ